MLPDNTRCIGKALKYEAVVIGDPFDLNSEQTLMTHDDIASCFRPVFGLSSVKDKGRYHAQIVIE